MGIRLKCSSSSQLKVKLLERKKTNLYVLFPLYCSVRSVCLLPSSEMCFVLTYLVSVFWGLVGDE